MYSVIHRLHFRTRAVSSLPDLLRTEKEHVREVLTKCKHPLWAPDRMEYKNSQQNNISRGPWKSIRNICSKYGIQTYFKGNKSVKNILVCHQKINTSWNRKVELFIGTGAKSWNLMMSTYENQVENLVKCSKNILKYFHPYMATRPSLATPSPWANSA